MTHGTRVSGTIRPNRDVPESLRHLRLKTGEYRCKRKGDVLVQAWKLKQKVVYMVSTIHSGELMKTNKIHWKTKQEMIKPHSVIKYNKYMMGVDLADQYLSYYSIMRKTVKWTKKTVLFLLNSAMFNAFRLYIELNGNIIKYKQFLYTVGHSWIEEFANAQDVNDTSSTSQSNTSSTSVFVPKPRT